MTTATCRVGDAAPLQPRTLRFRLDDTERTRLVADYEAGIPTTQLAANYDLAKASVLRLLRSSNVTVRRQGLNCDEAAQAQVLYESGLSLAAVGDQLGLAPTSVSRALVRAGVTLRPGRRRV